MSENRIQTTSNQPKDILWESSLANAAPMQLYQPQNNLSQEITKPKLKFKPFGGFESSLIVFLIFCFMNLVDMLVYWKKEESHTQNSSFDVCYMIGLGITALPMSFVLVA